MTDGMNKICARLAVVTMVAFGASACSSMPDWVDPTNWGSDHAGPPQAGNVDAAPGETPDLASIPDRPGASTTPDEQQQVAGSLAADRSRAQYSADALRGGTEPVAPPPPPAGQVASTTPTMPANSDINTADTAPPPSSDIATDTSPPPAADTQVATATDLPPAQSSEPPAAQMTAPPPPRQQAMPTVAQINPSDAALGFKPSTAPPLDASIAQFVPPPIVARYNQTASAAGLSAPHAAPAISDTPRRLKRSKQSTASVGGPENMSGAVVAHLEVLQQTPDTTQAAYSNAQGLPPTSVVFFPGDGTLLGADGKARVRAAVAEFKQRGSQGFIRVVGHSSSRTTNMPLEQHLVVIFNKSQDRANAVAKELIREGVPAGQVLVEAVGDSQPVYYESMPKGEDGNRRAEIFLQG